MFDSTNIELSTFHFHSRSLFIYATGRFVARYLITFIASSKLRGCAKVPRWWRLPRKTLGKLLQFSLMGIFFALDDALRLTFVSRHPLQLKLKGRKINQPAFDPTAASIHIKNRTSTRNRVIDSMSAGKHASLLIGSTKIHFSRFLKGEKKVVKWKVLTHAFIGFNRLQTPRPDRLKIDAEIVRQRAWKVPKQKLFVEINPKTDGRNFWGVRLYDIASSDLMKDERRDCKQIVVSQCVTC